MNFIKKVFEEKIDNSVHLQFQKFGKGEFKDRALIKVKKSKEKYTISTSAEFANEFVKSIAEKLNNDKARTQVKGIIVSTNDLQGLDYQNKKQFMGIKQYVIDKEMSGEEILNLLDKFQKAFFALSFNAGESLLKIKAKAPKSSKPSNKGGEKPKIDFCKLSTNDEKIAKDFVFEKPDFKSAEITHKFLINEIIVPDELKNEKDFSKVREMAKKKGKIIRKAVIDGKEIMSEREFVA